MVPPKNIVGPQLRKLRYQRGLTQDMFAAQCSVRGFEMSRVTLSKIEAQVRCVVDSELLAFAQILGVDLRELFPKNEGRPR